MATYSSWKLSNDTIEYEPKETVVSETVLVFTSNKQGIVPPSDNKSTNTGQYILAENGTWIPQPAFTSGGSDAFETLRPSNFSTTYSIFPPTPVNPSYAYDVDDNHATTFGEWEFVFKNRSAGLTDVFIFNTWAAKGQTWTAATINVSRSYGYFNDGESNSTAPPTNRISSVKIEYSVDNGTNWYTIATDLATSTPLAATTSSAALPSLNPTMTNVLLKFTVYRGGGGMVYDPDIGFSIPGTTGDMDLKIYDVWISGTYAGGAGNITCNNLSVTGDATFSGKIKDGTGSAGTSGYVLSSTGTQTLWVPDSTGSGTVTSITTTGANGVTISGGSTQTITTSGIFALALGNITPTSIVTGTGSFSGDVEFASSIKSPNGSNSHITIAPDGTGDLHVNADSMRLGDNASDATFASRNGDLIITTNEGSGAEGIVRLYDGANGNITLTPNGTGQVQVGTDQVVTLAASQTLTNKSISGSTNTLSNIANASLTNSTISGVSLGSNLNALTISSPLTGTSFNGSSAVSIGIPVATTSASGYLSSTDWTTFNSKLSPSDTYYIGTTSNAFNRSSAAQSLTGVSIDGSAPAGSLTGATLASGVTASSLTSVGTLGSLTVSGNATFDTNTLFVDATNDRVGIGTASPSSALHVARPSGTSTYFQLAQTSIESWQIGMSAGSTALAFLNSGTERMRLTDAGLLGIGTASPSATAKVTARDATYGLYRAENTVGGAALFGISANATSEGILDATNAFNFKVDGTVRAYLNGTGLGIGTASPSQKLSVSNNIILGTAVSGAGTPAYIDTGLNYSNGSTRDKCKIYLYNSGTEQYGFSVGSSADVQYHSNAIHDFYIANSQGMRLNSTGLGIGTSNVLAKLNIATTDTRIEFGQASSSIAYIEVLNAARTAALSLSSYALGFDWLTNTGSGWTSRLSITNSGNVGIGTASPSAKLHVNGSTISSNFYIPAGSAGTYGLADLSSAIQTYSGSVSPANSMLFYSSGTERMRIDSTQVKATVPFIGNSGSKGFGCVITNSASPTTPSGGAAGDHYYYY